MGDVPLWEPTPWAMGVEHALYLALQTIARLHRQCSTHPAPPLCNPNTTLIGKLPWCDW